MKHIEGQLIIQLVAVLVFSLGIQSCTKQASVDQGDMYVIPI